jgi:hypothetical protein
MTSISEIITVTNPTRDKNLAVSSPKLGNYTLKNRHLLGAWQMVQCSEFTFDLYFPSLHRFSSKCVKNISLLQNSKIQVNKEAGNMRVMC